jgi:hypothetical protein
MSNPFAKNRHCPHCGTDNPPNNQACWLCHGSLSSTPEVTAELAQRPSSISLTEGFFAGLLVACGVLVVLVGIGIAQEDQGMFFLYLIVVTPVALATGCHWLIARARGKRASAVGMFVTFIVSGLVATAVAVLIVAAIVVAAVVALLQFCASLGSGHP